jgi:glycosyltransferase involved in cell wall biosynthesis
MLTNIVDFLIIIPTYKRPGPLCKAIQSAISQTNVTKHIIVADDCPDGSAVEVVRQFPKVIYLKNPKPSGGWPGRVRNFAFDSAREMGIVAEYVHFLDDDDTVPHGHYDVVKEAFCSHPGIGVIFGLLRPFCEFSEDPGRRRRQELQLQDVRNWRIEASRFPWFYDQISATPKLPIVAQWLYRQHAIFGAEMFLCSGGTIRYEHVGELGGFPDIRITQDYFFYTDAIRKFGCLFLKRETAGYGVGDTGAVWNPLDLDGAAKTAHTNEWMQELRMRSRNFRAEMGYFMFYARKIIYRIGHVVLNRGVFPVLDRRGYFTDLYRITNPD